MQQANAGMQAVSTGLQKEQSTIGLEKVIDSIIAIASFESDALKNNRKFDLATINMRKARLLLDFNSAARATDKSQISPPIHESLLRMRAVLARNLSQYQSHATAVQEVVNMIMETAQAQQDDGTYSARKSF
jgi:hypothetical protein